MSFPPEIFLIGAQKSGTTTLAYWLSQHPQVCVSVPKEPHFFTRNWDKGFAWYQNRFSNYKNAVCVDASVTYSAASLSLKENLSQVRRARQGVPQRVYSINPAARFIYLLREPVERTYSGYWMSVNLGREKKSFAEAIRRNSDYLDISDYYGQLALWLEHFPLESFLFLLFEDLKKNPEQVVKDCFNFIGVDSKNCQIHPEVKNKSRVANVVGRRFNSFCFRLDNSEVGYLAPPYMRELVQKFTTDSRGFPEMPEKEQEFLRGYFSEKNYQLELLTGLALSQW